MTLFELNTLVRDVVENAFDEEYWVEGELSDARVAGNGHFYGELIQKEENGRNIMARARVNCWARVYNVLRFRFQNETGQSLRQGIQVKVLVKVSFHEQYGYALNIIDIDSTYTLGDLAKRRREILNQLEEDGILHDNQQLEFPRLLNRIAIISAQGAAGYGDFMNQLLKNEYSLEFQVQLFPAVMQGQHVEESVIAALECIQNEYQNWDAVVIIRGGGATGDLSDFDSYPLAACIAQFPLPVITGIGHERDETVLDYVAHTHVKTPTAAAALILDHQLDEASLLENLQNRITTSAREHLQHEKQRIEKYGIVIPLAFGNMRERQQNKLEHLNERMQYALTTKIEKERHKLEILGERLKGLDPTRLLKLGYSITVCGDKIVRDITDLREGDVLTTHVQSGKIYSRIELCKKN